MGGEGILVKYFSANIKRQIILKVDCPESDYWQFFDDNVKWLEGNEVASDASCDIRTRISRLPEINDSVINDFASGYDRLGYNLFVRPSSVVCIYGGWLLWRYEVAQDGKVDLDICYSDHRDSFLMKMARRIMGRKSSAQIIRERFLHLTRIGIHFPVFSFLSANENVGIMHAAAVEKDSKPVVLAGYDGVGKSTLAIQLCLKNDFRCVADNFLLYDENCIYPFLESARLNEDSVQHLALSRVGKKIHGRTEVLPGPCTSHASLKGATVFFNYISGGDSSCKIEEVDEEALKKKLLAMESYLPEFIHYKEFLSVSGLAGGASCGSSGMHNPLDAFLSNSRLYLLERHSMRDIPEVAKEVIECAQMES